MELTEDDVLEILKLFEQSKFDFLQLEQGERKITVSKGGYISARTDAALAAAPARPLPAAAAPPPAAPRRWPAGDGRARRRAQPRLAPTYGRPC